MPYNTYTLPDGSIRIYWSKQTKSAAWFKHGFAPNTANFVRNLIFHECSIPLQLYVETFIPAFIDMLIFENLPFWDDIVRASGEALVGRGASPGRKGHRHTGLVQLPEPEGKAERLAAQGLKTLLRLTQPLENIGYVMLLYAGTERFTYNWNSMLYGFKHCGRPPSEGPLQRHSDVQGLPIAAGDNPLYMQIVDQNRANWPTSNQLVTVPRGHYQVTVSATFTSRASNQSKVQIGILAGLSLPYDPYDSDYAVMEPKGPGTCLMTAHVYFPLLTGGTIQWVYRGDAVPVGITIEHCEVSIYSFQPGR
jgi:hypothetical protein